MALVTIDTVGKLQAQQKTIYWKVCDKSKKLVINRNDEAMSLNDSIDLLRDTLKNCIGDYCSVTLYTEKPTQLERGSVKGKLFELLVQLDSSKSYAHIPSGTNDNFDKMLDLHKKVMELEFEKRIAEEKQEETRQKPLDKLIDKITEGDTINLLISAFMNKVSKAPEHIGTTTNNDLEKTLEKLSKVDSNYQHTLAKMAVYLEKNPGVLAQIKAIIGA